jgi:hypothetical protein
MDDNDYGSDDDCGNECEDPEMKAAIKASMNADFGAGDGFDNGY